MVKIPAENVISSFVFLKNQVFIFFEARRTPEKETSDISAAERMINKLVFISANYNKYANDLQIYYNHVTNLIVGYL